MLASLIAAVVLLVPQSAVTDPPAPRAVDDADVDAQRARLRQVLPLLAERPMSAEMVEAYKDLHGRAWRLGDAATAHAAIDRIVGWWEEQYGPDATDFADSLNNLANLLQDLGDYAGARPLYERSLAISEAALGPEHPRVANSLNNLANLLTGLGDFAGARPLYERCLAIWEAALGPEHPRVADGLNNLANLLKGLGDFAGARPLYERCLAISEAAYGPEHPRVADGLNNLAALLKGLGDFAGARPLYERSLAIWEAAYGPEHPDVGTSLTNLANLLSDLGDFAAARPLSERSLAIQEAALGPGHPRVANSLNNLAILLRDLGDHAAARPLSERSLAIREAALGPEHPDVANSLNTLAALLTGLGDFAGARPLSERSLAVREAALGPEHPDVGQSLNTLAALLLDTGEAEVAHRYALRLVGRRGQLRQTLASLTTGESHLYLAKQRESRHTLLATAQAVEEPAAAYATVLDSKGQVARLTLQTRAQIRASLDPETLARTESLARLQARLSRLALEADVRDRVAHDALLESLRTERDALERELRRAADIGAEQAVTTRDVAEALPTGSAVVDLLVHPDYVPARFQDGEFVEKGRWSESRVSAWIVRAGEDAVVHVDLGPAAVIEAAVSAFLEDLVARRGVAVAQEEGPGSDVNADLRNLAWDPLVAHLDGIDTVFVSPDGVLGTLPYETLQDESGRFLVERYAFVYPTDVASMVGRPEAIAPLGDIEAPLLAIGGVDFRKRATLDGVETPGRPVVAEKRGGGSSMPVPSDALRGSFNQYWGRLPATEYESQVVSDMHEDALLDDASRLLLQGADASEERLKAEMPRHAILHLATHGFFQPEGLPSMWEQALDAVSGERGMQMSETAARLTGLHPGLLSGLVLAGANRPPEDDASDPDAPVRDDGYLTASEVTLLDLSGVDLVVLSACETGLGRPQSGEGLLGLRRAFHMAGADTVVSSLWSVKDESTSELMQSFYANLFFKGMGRHEALRAAQLEMLQRNRMEHGAALPSTWGAFVLSGEWR